LPNLLPPAAGASAQAAIATAAHTTLSTLFPSQQLFFDMKLTQAGLTGTGIAEGQAFGLLVAQQLLNDRSADPNASDAGYMPLQTRGGHRPDPDNPNQGFHAPFYGARSKCFAVTARHGLSAPPLPGTPDYTRALREVRGKGIAPELMGTLPTTGLSQRTANETLIGLYWGYDGALGLGTPPRLYNQIVKIIAIAKNNSLEENARLFALVNAAMADAGILAWDQKYIHNFWRPVVGIREHDVSMGPTGIPNNTIDSNCDISWLPLGAPSTNSTKKNFTPPFPADPSGHATFGAAALHITRLFYGVTNYRADNLFNGLSFVSEELDGANKDNKGTVRPRHRRNFPDGLWGMIVENGLSRVYLGVHWIFDAFVRTNNGEVNMNENVGGIPLGIKIAEDIFNGGRIKGLTKSTVRPRP
jgi:vanadium chloroperoxidase